MNEMLAGAMLLALTISIFVVTVLQPVRWVLSFPGRVWEAAKQGIGSLWDFLTNLPSELASLGAGETEGSAGNQSMGNQTVGGVGG